MIKATRWVQAAIALDADDKPIGILYMGKHTKPYPSATTPLQAPQSLQTMPRIEQVRHPPSREEVRKAYGH